MRSAANDSGEQLIIWGGEPTVSLDVQISDDYDENESDEGDDLVDFDFLKSSLPASHDAPEEMLAPMGGRMQALALSAALALEGEVARQRHEADACRTFILAAGTDGRDGPTDACGAIIDAFTSLGARERGRDPGKDLQWHRSYHSLNSAGALLRTGPTGTNVMDVVAVYIARATTNE